MTVLMRVVLIVGTALLPPLLMQGFNAAALRSAQHAQVQEQALHDAKMVATEIEALIGGVRNALVATAAVPVVRSGDARCGPLLEAVLAELVFLRTITLVGEDGRVICASDPAAAPFPADRFALVRAAQARGELALGSYSVNPATGGGELPAAYPVRALPGPGPVLVGAIDLARLRERLAQQALPEWTTLTVADHDGTVLIGLPDAERVGRPVPWRMRAAGTAPAIWREIDGMGVDRVVAVLPPGAGGADVLVSVGLATSPALAAAEAASTRGYALIGGGFLVALALAAALARGAIARPVRAILAVTERWQNGDTAARVPATEIRSEFGRIAAAVNRLLNAVVAGQARLHEHLAELRAIYDGAPVGLGYFDRTLRIVAVNARLAEIAGLSAAGYRGRTIGDILPDLAPLAEPLLTRALAGEPIAPVEMDGGVDTSSGKSRCLLVSFHPAVAPGGGVVGVVVAIQDITDLRRAEEALRTTLERANAELERRVAERTLQLEAEVREREAAQAQLQQAQKMEVIGQLTGGVAHDFNNLLTALIGNLELAMARSRDRPEVMRLLQAAMRSADRGASLTQRMLAFGRRQLLRFQPVSIPGLLEGMEELLQRTIGPSVRIVIEAPAGLRPARADPNQVELIVLNLVVNARDAMPQGGTITLAAAEDRVVPGAPHPAGLAPGDYIRLDVTDTGVGMDAATLARVFEPFFTTKPVGRGSGLGLPMVHGVAAQSEGGVFIHSEPGQGTTVTVWLPCADVLASPASPVAAPSAAALLTGMLASRKPTVLLVDDDADVAVYAATCLEEAGYIVQRAGSGQDALRLLETAPPPDLLIADLGLPETNGVQLAAIARQRHPDLPVLIVTGYAPEDADPGGVLDLPVLTKPFTAAELLCRVVELTAAPTAPAAMAQERVPLVNAG